MSYSCSDFFDTIMDALDAHDDGTGEEGMALNIDQVNQYKPPPNPAKLTDSRAEGYIAVYGDESWELDALDPDVIAQLIRDQIEGEIDTEAWAASNERVEDERERLRETAENWRARS